MSKNIIFVGEVNVEDLLLHQKLDEMVVLAPLSGLHHVMLNRFYQLRAYGCQVISWNNTASNRINYLLVGHVVKYLFFEISFQLLQHKKSEVILCLSSLSRKNISLLRRTL